MRKLMVLAAMLAMVMVVAAPALAQQTSGAASSGGATLTAGDLANQCVQVANNVNSGNVDQSADIDVAQQNLGILAEIETAATGGAGGAGGEGGTVIIVDGLVVGEVVTVETPFGLIEIIIPIIDAEGGDGGDGGDATAVNTGDINISDVTQTQTNTSNNTITQTGIEQINNAKLTCEQAIAQAK